MPPIPVPRLLFRSMKVTAEGDFLSLPRKPIVEVLEYGNPFSYDSELDENPKDSTWIDGTFSLQINRFIQGDVHIRIYGYVK